MADNNINLIIIGENERALEKQRSILSYISDIKTKLICSKSIIDFIDEHTQDESSIVIINLTVNGLRELQYLNQLNRKKAAIIIIGDKSDIDLLSLAIRVGVKDFIDNKDYETQLDDVFCNIKKTIARDYKPHNVKRLNAIMSVKGGSGASFIASNVAYIIAKESQSKVALIDLDMQLGSIGLNFDITPKYTLADAVEAIDELDSISLEAYMSKYNDYLSLLLPSPTEMLLPGEINLDKLQKLLNLLKINYSQVVIDLPRLIDPLSSMILEQADEITLIFQQNLVQFRNGCRLVQILHNELDIPLDKMTIVINRYDPKNSLHFEDLKKAVNHDRLYKISNDYVGVPNASNLGIPFYECSAKSKISQELKELAKNLGKVDFKEVKKRHFNLFNRL